MELALLSNQLHTRRCWLGQTPTGQAAYCCLGRGCFFTRRQRVNGLHLLGPTSRSATEHIPKVPRLPQSIGARVSYSSCPLQYLCHRAVGTGGCKKGTHMTCGHKADPGAHSALLLLGTERSLIPNSGDNRAAPRLRKKGRAPRQAGLMAQGMLQPAAPLFQQESPF